MSILRDHISRHHCWELAEDPDYNNYDARAPLKLAKAIAWMQTEGRGWRGEVDCKHVYRNASGKRTEK